MTHRRYAIIAPGRNEAKFMRRTLDSLIAQSVRPAMVVVVDDGSTDESPAILAEYAAKHDWIRVVTRKDRGTRSVGPGVIEAFYAGLGTIKLDDYDYVCKLDLDLVLPQRYFELLMQRMEANPRLGCLSGRAYYPGPSNAAEDFAGELIPEAIGDEVTVGASKFYRVACFKQIGGFVRQVMWDGIDCHRARMLGWQVGSTPEPEARFIHLRPMGSSHGNIWKGRKRHGFGQWFMGTGLLFMTASAIYRLPRQPVFVGSLAIYLGYLESMMKRLPRYGDAGFRRFLRRYQLESLVLGKNRAAARAEARSSHHWNPNSPGEFEIPPSQGDAGRQIAAPSAPRSP
ncbi:MAG: glycosyltransferase family 2 protein [Planctomycetes bacterium]|nr:glycosyltransferase family 2 protein [Planctomycetota bacterium]